MRPKLFPLAIIISVTRNTEESREINSDGRVIDSLWFTNYIGFIASKVKKASKIMFDWTRNKYLTLRDTRLLTLTGFPPVKGLYTDFRVSQTRA